jgi:uncharacterized protein (DUF433 family)
MPPPQKALRSFVSSDTDILGGRLVFRDTRVPIETLFENLADGLSLDEIVASYPSLNRDDLVAVLAAVGECLNGSLKNRESD